MITIRSKLLLLLWFLLTALTAATAYWNYQNIREELLNLFDNQLVQEGLTLQAQHQALKNLPDFSDNPDSESTILDIIVNPSYDNTQALPDYFLTHQLPRIFQIWSPEQTLLEKSGTAPGNPLTTFEAGLSSFNESDISSWRVFTLVDTDGFYYVLAEPAHIRNMLVDNIALAQSVPMACLWLALLLIGGWCIRWSLQPLEKVSNEIASRHSDYLTPIDPQYVPLEARPMVNQINHLLARVEDSFAREKRFTADASHELRTPLAALQIQAQVAMDLTDPNARKDALRKMMLGVERCTHVIHQLGILAKIRPQEPLRDITEVDLGAIAVEVIAELAPSAVEKNIDIHLNKPKQKSLIQGNLTLIRIMMRNIIDNAIRYSEAGQPIAVSVIHKPDEFIFQVNDQGPGIPLELRERVFERFYRGLGHAATGSGLGLSIVEQITLLHHANIILDTAGGKGLSFNVSFPNALSYDGAK